MDPENRLKARSQQVSLAKVSFYSARPGWSAWVEAGSAFYRRTRAEASISQKGITEEKELVRENRTAAQEAAQEGMSVEAFCVEFEQPSLHSQKKIAIHATCLFKDCSTCCICMEGHRCIGKCMAPVYNYPPVLDQLRHWSQRGWSEKKKKEQNSWKA